MSNDLPFVLAAPEHPSLDGAIERFCDALRGEVDAPGPRPASTLIRRLACRGTSIRLAAASGGEILGVAAIDVTAPCGPELLVAVVERWRGRGVASALAQAIVARADAAGLERIVVHTSRSSTELRAVGTGLGFQVVDVGRGRLDLMRTLSPVSRSA